MYDTRLLGTWKSDTRKTLHELWKTHGAKRAEEIKKTGILGKLQVRYTRKKMHCQMDGKDGVSDYTVLGKDEGHPGVDSGSVVIQYWTVSLKPTCSLKFTLTEKTGIGSASELFTITSRGLVEGKCSEVHLFFYSSTVL